MKNSWCFLQVMVGKLGDELQFDSWMLLFYNCLWSLPLSLLLVLSTGEASRLLDFPGLYSASFLVRPTSNLSPTPAGFAALPGRHGARHRGRTRAANTSPYTSLPCYR